MTVQTQRLNSPLSLLSIKPPILFTGLMDEKINGLFSICSAAEVRDGGKLADRYVTAGGESVEADPTRTSATQEDVFGFPPIDVTLD